MRRLVALTGLWFATAFANAQQTQAPDDPSAQSTLQLEVDFARARDLELVHAVASMPEDVRRKMLSFNEGFAVAELGATWNRAKGAADTSSTPTAQHLFSAISDRLFVVLVQTAAGDIKPGDGVVLLLGYRDSPEFCTYAFGELPIWRLRLDSIQEYFEPRGKVAPRQGPSCRRR